MTIVDTNVLIAGLLTNNSDAPTARILDAMLAGTMHFIVSPALLAEYRAVSLRPAITRRHGLSAQDVDELLTTLVHNAMWRESTGASTPARDPGDNHLWALLAHEPNASLITGDRLLLDNPMAHGRVISPTTYLQSGAGLSGAGNGQA